MENTEKTDHRLQKVICNVSERSILPPRTHLCGEAICSQYAICCGGNIPVIREGQQIVVG